MQGSSERTTLSAVARRSDVKLAETIGTLRTGNSR